MWSNKKTLEAISKTLSKDDYDARKVQESQVVPPVILVSYEQAPEVTEPRKQSLDLPSSSIPPQWPAVLSLLPFPAIGCDHLDAHLQQRYVEPVTVIRFVTDQPVRQCPRPSRVQRRLDKSDFTRGSAFRVDGDRTTSSVCNRHDLGPFPTLRGTDKSPPFRAATNVPSMKHSDRSTPPRSSRSRTNAFITDSSTPALTQDWKRRWQVARDGYRSGKSFQGAPVRRIHRIPFNTDRSSTLGRPRPSSLTGDAGRCGSTTTHCSSVKSIRFSSKPNRWRKPYHF